MKPLYTLLEYRTKNGPKFLIVRTAHTRFACSLGLHSLEECVGILRGFHAQKYVIISESGLETVHPIPKIPKEIPEISWLKDFLSRVRDNALGNSQKIELEVSKRNEIDHCTVHQTLKMIIRAAGKELMVTVSIYDSFSGTHFISSIACDNEIFPQIEYEKLTENEKECVHRLYFCSEQLENALESKIKNI